jgi:hypothetical protein
VKTHLVLLAGEGRNELGSRVGHPTYQTGAEIGVLERLLRRASPGGFDIHSGRQWKDVRKFSVSGRRSPGAPKRSFTHGDAATVFKLVFDAKEAGCSALVFVRDLDNEPGREGAIREGMEAARQDFQTVALVGAVAKPKLEGWVLAALGVRGTESLTPAGAERALAEHEVQAKSTAEFVAVIEEADFTRIPRDAESLHAFMDCAKRTFAP